MLTIEQRLQHLEDEAAIRDVTARFADAATRGDHETIRSLWKPDGVFMIGEPFAVTCKGIDEIDALLAAPNRSTASNSTGPGTGCTRETRRCAR